MLETSGVASRVSKTFRGSRRKVGFPSRRCSGKGAHIALRGEFPGCSQVVAVKSGFPLSYDGDFRDPAYVASGMSSLHASCQGPLGIPFQLVLRPRYSSDGEARTSGSSPVLTWISGFLWSFNMGVRPCLFQSHGSPLSFRALKLVSGFLSS